MKLNRFAKFAWFVVAYHVFVILWGAFVRASGSGAGCGSHWPTCNGQVIPRPEQIETLIEFFHRVTSGLAGVFVIVLLVWAFRRYPKASFGRWMAVLSLIFVIVEGGIGAALVRFELVAGDTSAIRGLVVALHLVNTLVLLTFLTLAAWHASGREHAVRVKRPGTAWMLGIGLAGLVIVSTAGAVTALGDTLFPAESLQAGVLQDLDPTAHFLIRLRVIHPMIAVAVSVYLLAIAGVLLETKANVRVSSSIRALRIVIALQLVGGLVNVILLAPVWMQIIHLLLADLLWIILIELAAELLTEEQVVETG
ncbi:MAG: COX15/CtaA family protein [Anaerolineales bacterium]|nr:COX15/CtaA family protein [Anaerolineales bacterium]